MEERIAELLALRQELARLQRRADELSESIKLGMSTAGVEEVRAAGVRITWKNVTTSRLDIGALKKAMPELADAFTKKTTVTRFTISA